MAQDDSRIVSTPKVTPEQAQTILNAGKLVSNGKVVHVFQSENFEDMEQWGIDDVLGKDIIIHSVRAKTISGQYGQSYMCFIGLTPEKPTATVLINTDGVLGQQLKRFINGNQFPLWVYVSERMGGQYGHFYTFEPPKVLTSAIEPTHGESGDLEDLPF